MHEQLQDQLYREWGDRWEEYIRRRPLPPIPKLEPGGRKAGPRSKLKLDLPEDEHERCAEVLRLLNSGMSPAEIMSR